MKPAIGLPAKSLKASAEILSRILTDEIALSLRTRDAHWNVKGPLFAALHELFDKQYQELGNAIDEVAERIRALGEPVMGQITALAQTAITDIPPTGNPQKLTHSLLEAHELVIRNLREAVDATEKLGDNVTSDFLIGLMADHEKTAWMLRSSL
jgi:starvation-inducible DNA-binding protein